MQTQQEPTTVLENKEQIQQQNNTQDVNSQPVEQTENEQEKNWKKFREQRELERKQLEEERKRAKQKEEEAAALKAAMDALLNKPPVNSIPNHDPYQEESEEVRIQKKVEQALLDRERKLEDERRQKEQAEMPIKLKHTFRDFDQVCSAENVDYLEYHYPEIATPFNHMPNTFEKWAAVYQAIKRFVPNTDSKKDQKKAEKNFNKPQSMAAAGVTQTGDQAPIMLDDKRRADNWARMQKVMRGGR